MKKFISVLILLALLSAAAFAELSVSFELDMTQNLFSLTNPLGNDADTKANPSNRYPGSLDFFTQNRNEMRSSEMYLRFDWEKEYFDARLELVGNRLINRRDRSLREGYSFLDLFDELAVGDFWVRGDFENVNAAYGRLNTRGVMNAYRFDNDTWWDRRHTGNANLGPYRFFGYQMPGFGYNEVNNHAAIHGYEHYVMVGGKFADFGLELSGSRNTNTAVTNGSAISLGARIFGAQVADLINFEVMYGVNGSDPTMSMFGDENGFANVGPFADGKGRWEHRFGVYGGLDLMDGGLGIAFGYSGAIEIFEKWEAKATPASPNEKDLQIFGPFYSGVDLKAQFRGLENLTITAAVNASFSNVKGVKFEDQTWNLGLGILSPGVLGEKQEESFFGLAAGLNFNYQLNDNLDANLQLKNSAQWTGYINDETEFNQLANQFGLALTARYKMGDFFSVTGGLAMQFDHVAQDVVKPTLNYSGGDVYIGFPITFNVSF